MTRRAENTGFSERMRAFLRDRRGLAFAVPATALAVLVILAAINLDRGTPRESKPSRIDGAAELLPPRLATPEELARASGGPADQTAVALAAGAWIQVADETGRLAQQYSATRLEPLSGSQISMREPRAVIYQRDGRVLTLSARKGVAYVPRRALESGTLEDDVEVRLFRTKPDGSAIDPDTDTPAVVVTADQAQFDGVSGEVRCERAVRVATDAGSFSGEGLSLLLDGEGDGVERLVIDRALEPIRIDRAARSIAARRPASGDAVRAPTAPPPADGARARPFYRLVLLGGVEIVRVRGGVTSRVKGDELAAVFSLESRGLDDLAFVPRDAAFGADAREAHAMRGPAALAIVPLSLAAVDANLAQDASVLGDSVTVHFGGKLIMLPATDPADQLASKDDIRFDVIGQAVEVVDGRSASRIVCSRLRYDLPAERVEAFGRDGVPLTVANPRMRLDGARFVAELKQGRARVDGAGSLSFLRALRSEAVERAVDAQLGISWKGGLDLGFNRSGEEFALASARFGDGVRVGGRDFTMDAGSIDVAFSPHEKDRIDSIVADGGVAVVREGGKGALSARRLELALSVDGSGDPVPQRLVARDQVEVRDADRTIWTNDLVVSFKEIGFKEIGFKEIGLKETGLKDVGLKGRAEQAQPAATERVDGLGGAEIDRVEAKGGVEVLLKEGARVFADALLGEVAARRLQLTGDDVAIVRSNVMADNLRDLRFDESAQRATSEGTGRFRAFRDPLVAAAGRVGRPVPSATPTLEAGWGERLDYTELGDGRGTLDLRGDVKVRSKPDARTSDAVDAQSIALEIGTDRSMRAAGRAGDADAAAARRSLDRFLARGAARVESRRWSDAERSGDPEVFRVTGEHIEYDMRSREGRVEGAGSVLVNRRADPNSPVAQAAAAPGAISLGSDGTSRFRWTRAMALERMYDDVYRISMRGAVELLHAGRREDDTLSMQADQLEASLKRPVARGEVQAEKEGARTPDAGVDLGGPAELLGVRGLGGVFIRTPGQDVECGSFDYSVTTGVATLAAEERKTVTIAVKGQPSPIRAQQVVWDLRNGRLQVLKASGTAGR